MVVKVKRIQSYIDVLWDHVIIEGDRKEEVDEEMTRLMEESGNASFRPTMFRSGDQRWVTVGEVLRPH